MMNALAYTLPNRGRVLALRSLMPMVREGASTTWVHVAFEGEWKGHRSGAFEFTEDTFRQIVANFERSPNPVPMDYEHSIEYATHAPASGWVQKLEVRKDDDGRAHLWAFCELTDKAADHVRAGEYRFCSGVFDFGATDLVTGEEIGCAMDSLALVNSPFIRGQQPIRLSQRGAKRALGGTMTFTKEALLAALEQIEGDELSHEQLMAAADFAAAKDADPAESEEAEEPAEAPLADEPEEEEIPAPMAEPPAGEDDEDEVPMSEGGAPAAAPAAPAGDAVEAAEVDAAPESGEASAEAGVLESAIESAGLDVADLLAALQENAEAFKQLVSGALDTPAAPAPLSDRSGDQAILLSVERGKTKALSAQVKTLSDKLKRFEEAEADTLVGALVASGRLLPANRDDWRALCLSDRARFDKLSQGLSQVVPMSEHSSKSKPAPKATGDVIEIDEEHPYVKRTRASLKRVGCTDPEQQNQKIRDGLRALSARSNAQ